MNITKMGFDLYFDPKNRASFGGVSRLRAAVGKDPTNFFRSEPTYNLYKPVRRKFRRRKYVVKGIDSLWQADLADLKSLAKWNQGFAYVLVVIDVFSKYVWAEPVKSKDAKTVLAAFKKVLARDSRTPQSFMTDKGREFDNEQMRKFCKSKNINYYTSQNPDTKAAVAERVIRTLKTRLYRYFHHKKSWNYTSVLQAIVNSYNDSKHKSIGTAPNSVSQDNEGEVRRKLYPKSKQKATVLKFNVGDKVRIAKEKQVFGKGYNQQWSDEIFEVTARRRTDPPVYKLRDYAGEIIVGSFYAQELQLVTDSGVYEVQEILKTRTHKGKKEFYVRWKGYPESMNSWVTDLIS